MNRRTLLATALSIPALAMRRPSLAQEASLPAFAYPIGWAAGLAGDGFRIRHGFACENTWYNPGYWHTGEDWYALEGETGGAEVRAIAAGEVVFAGSDYPGRVVIVRHADDLFSMYGHLDYALAVGEGGPVELGQLLGTVLLQVNAAAPSHLHFEARAFLTTLEVNGDAPRYGFACGYQCPPGPGYWPIDAPEHPSAMGWLNPAHVVANHAFPDGEIPSGTVAAVATGVGGALPVHAEPSGDAEQVGELPGEPGSAYPLRSISHGPESSDRTSAEGYEVWYEIEFGTDQLGWAQAVVPSSFDLGSDGRPSSVELRLLVTRP